MGYNDIYTIFINITQVKSEVLLGHEKSTGHAKVENMLTIKQISH